MRDAGGETSGSTAQGKGTEKERGAVPPASSLEALISKKW